MFSVRFTFGRLRYSLGQYAICYTDGEKLLLHSVSVTVEIMFSLSFTFTVRLVSLHYSTIYFFRYSIGKFASINYYLTCIASIMLKFVFNKFYFTISNKLKYNELVKW